MPNHITNRIEIIGKPSEITELIEKLSTTYPETEMRAFDDTLIYKDKNGNVGWLNPKTNMFKRREMEDVEGIPSGFKPEMNAEWTRFPDFNKIVPMPDGLEDIQSDNFLMPLENQFCRDTKMKEHVDKLRDVIEKNPERAEALKTNFLNGIKYYLEFGCATWYSFGVKHWGTKWNCYNCKIISNTIFHFDTAWSGVPDLIRKVSLIAPNVTIKYNWADEDSGANTGSLLVKNGDGNLEKHDTCSKEAWEVYFLINPDRKDNFEYKDGNYHYKYDKEE